MMGFLREVTEIKYIRRFSAHNYYFTICRFTHKHLFQSQVKYVSLSIMNYFMYKIHLVGKHLTDRGVMFVALER